MLRRIFTKLVDGLLDPTDYKQIALRADERARRAEEALVEAGLRADAALEIAREDLRDARVQADRYSERTEQLVKVTDEQAALIKTLRGQLQTATEALLRLRELPAPERGIVWAMAQVDAGETVTHPILDGGSILKYGAKVSGAPIYHFRMGYNFDVIDTSTDLAKKVLQRFAHVDGWEVAGAEAHP